MKGWGQIKPVDIITYVALVVLIGATLSTWPENPHGGTLLGKYVGFMCLLTLFWWMDGGWIWLWRLLHTFYPILFIPVIFDSFADLLPWVSPVEQDPWLIQLDLALFGVHPTVWLERFIHPVLTELLTWAYTSYYFLPIILALALYQRGEEREFDRAIFGVVLCFYLSYLGYFLVPAIGPRFTLASLQQVELKGLLFAEPIMDTLNRLERFKQDAFPSGHTAVVLLVLYYARQSVRGLFWPSLPIVVALILSTVYLRYHYVVDVLAGIFLAGLCLLLERGMNTLGRMT